MKAISYRKENQEYVFQFPLQCLFAGEAHDQQGESITGAKVLWVCLPVLLFPVPRLNKVVCGGLLIFKQTLCNYRTGGKQVIVALIEPLRNHPATDNSLFPALKNHKIVFHNVTS